MKISRQTYTNIFSPTVSDCVRPTDADLWLEMERDFTVYDEEVKFDGGKIIRDGIGQNRLGATQAIDTVITNVLILDHWDVVRADVGLKDGCIQATGKTGNSDVQPEANIVISVGAEVIADEGIILTADGIDTHIRFICPQQTGEALTSGIITVIGDGTGPTAGTNTTICASGPWHMARMLQAADAFPMSTGLTGKGNVSLPLPPEEQVLAGAIGLKLHEDWSSIPATIDNCLEMAKRHDIQVAIHTDTLNESGFAGTTLGAFKGRTTHTYHTEGAGGGHAPDIIKTCGFANVLPSPTNPTRPFARNTIDEYLDMLTVCHHLDLAAAENVALAESRIRRGTIAAEDIFHDLGALSTISSDSQTIDRVSEVTIHT